MLPLRAAKEIAEFAIRVIASAIITEANRLVFRDFNMVAPVKKFRGISCLERSLRLLVKRNFDVNFG